MTATHDLVHRLAAHACNRLEPTPSQVYNMANVCELNRYQIYREIRLHGKLQHENAITLYGAFNQGDHVRPGAQGDRLLPLYAMAAAAIHHLKDCPSDALQHSSYALSNRWTMFAAAGGDGSGIRGDGRPVPPPSQVSGGARSPPAHTAAPQGYEAALPTPGQLSMSGSATVHCILETSTPGCKREA